jgi:hypothetical protein
MKSKISYLPFNLLWCIGTFVFCFLVTWNFDFQTQFGLSLLAYSIDVKAACAEDWLNDRIEELEK